MGLFMITCPPTGIYRDVPFDVYRSWDAVSQSDLKKFSENARKFRYFQQNKISTKTAFMEFGSQVHSALLTPDEFRNEYFVIDQQIDRRTKDGAAIWNDAVAKFGEGRIIKLQDHERIKRCCDSLSRHKEVSNLLKITPQTDRELSFVWKHKSTGQMLKGRIDLAVLKINTVADLKVTQSADKEKFRKKIVEFGYHIQGAYYLEGLRSNGLDMNTFVFIVVEDQSPHCVSFLKLRDSAIELGSKQFDAMLHQYQICSSTNFWPDYTQGIEEIDLPGWAYPREELYEEAA